MVQPVAMKVRQRVVDDWADLEALDVGEPAKKLSLVGAKPITIGIAFGAS